MYTFEMILQDRSALVIFCGRNQGSDLDYGESLDITLKSFTGSYNAILFLVPRFIKEKILELISLNDRLISNISRYGSNTIVSFYSFDEYGLLDCFTTLGERVSIYKPDTKLRDIVIQQGIESLVRKRSNSIILAAPPGTTFKKPSDDTYIEFIKASELAVGCAENQFIAFCLLASRPRNREIKNIYIDSNSIAAFIVALICYLREFKESCLCDFNYISFNSYDGLEKNEPDHKDDIWVIVSASSSNNMGKLILKIWKGISHDQIVTLLSFADTERLASGKEKGIGDKIVANISEFSSKRNNPKKVEKLIPLQIIGENFTAQVDPPELVLLKKTHLPNHYKQFIVETSSLELFSLNKYDGRKVRGVCFNSNNFLDGKSSVAFYEWLKSVVVWNIPYGIKYVAFSKDDLSAQKIFNYLATLLPSQVTAIDLNDIAGRKFGDCSVLVISPVISSGRVFLRANRDLRMTNHSGPRVFISLMTLFKSQRSLDMFEKSLLQVPGDFKYKFFSYRTLCVGDTHDTRVWENELSVIEAFNFSPFNERASFLRNTSEGIPRGVGFSGTIDPLGFNRDFAFWGSKYKPHTISHGAVYLTIAAVLQHLRDKPTAEPDSLYHHVYKHAVLNPENFSRFNEGLIQACLWRAAEGAEVNYKYIKDASESFQAILLNLAKEYAISGKNALPDLLIGIAVGKIQLHDDSLVAIIANVRTTVKNSKSVTSLVDYIDSVILKGENPMDAGPPF